MLTDFQEMFEGKSDAEKPFKSTVLYTYLYTFRNPRSYQLAFLVGLYSNQKFWDEHYLQPAAGSVLLAGEGWAPAGTVSSSCSNCTNYCLLPPVPPFLTEGEWHLCQAQQGMASPFWAGVTKASKTQTHRGPGGVIFNSCWGSWWLAQLPLQRQSWT